MSKIDGRKISHDVRERIRIQAIQEWLDGLKAPAVAVKYGTSKKIVYQWIHRYKDGGFEALKTKPGIGRGQKSKLSQEQKDRLSLILRVKNPKDYGYQTALWTCAIVTQVIKDEFDIEYSVSSINTVLHKLGFTPQKPRWGAWQQDPKKRQSG